MVLEDDHHNLSFGEFWWGTVVAVVVTNKQIFDWELPLDVLVSLSSMMKAG